MYYLVTRINRFITVLTYPFMLILTFVCLLMVVTFCIFPTLVCMAFGVCLYYCMMEDPIPLSVLLRYMLSPDPDDNPYPHNYPQNLSRGAIESKVIVRKVLKIEGLSGSDDKVDDGVTRKETQEYPRLHPSTITVVTDYRRLYFSEPIVYEENVETVSGKESTRNTPDYLQPGTNPVAQIATENGPSLAVEVADEEAGNGGEFIPVSHTREEIELVEVAVEIANDAVVNGEENLILPENEASTPNEEEEGTQKTIHKVKISEDYEESNAAGKGTVAVKTSDSNAPAVNIGETDVEAISEGVADYFGIDDTRDRGTTCDICLLDYEVGDEVAWSRNINCVHVFHKDCILDWLVRKSTCPNCRTDYLQCNHDDNV